MPKVSVVIPCYNQGHYLNEAVDSVLDQTYKDFEIIIINDGSTDEHTNTLLSNYDRPKTKIIHTNNQGLPSARNKGIKEAQGLYILPLDADDKIGPNYLKEAVYILDGNPNIGIVYCEAEYFGEKTGKWNLEEYRKEVMLINNLIFCSAFFRKSIWKEIGGYNPEMIKGLEDWGYWLKIISLGFEVFKLPEIHFYYRVKKESMVKSLGQSHDNMYEMFILALFDNVALYKNYKMHLFSALKRYTIDASISVVSKIFYINDQESDYSQTTQVVTVQGEFVEYLFSFKDLKLVKNIRFTPAENSFCHFKLVELTSDGLDISASDSNAQKGFDGWDYFYTNNPTYTIYGDFSNATWLRIKGQIRLLNNSEITQELEQKNQELEQKNQELEQKNQEIEQLKDEVVGYVTSRSWLVTRPLRKVIRLLKR